MSYLDWTFDEERIAARVEVNALTEMWAQQKVTRWWGSNRLVLAG